MIPHPHLFLYKFPTKGCNIKLKDQPKMKGFYSLISAIGFTVGSLAADCTRGNTGCSVAQFWQVRDIACNSRQFGNVDCGNGWKVSAGLQFTVNKDANQAYNEHCWVRLLSRKR